jgi:hypothetical protein
MTNLKTRVAALFGGAVAHALETHAVKLQESVSAFRPG